MLRHEQVEQVFTPAVAYDEVFEYLARLAKKNGLDVRAIPVLLGHAKLEITQRYLNITEGGVVRSMRERWGKRPAAGRAQG